MHISNINNFVNFKNYILSKSNFYNNFIGHLNKHNYNVFIVIELKKVRK